MNRKTRQKIGMIAMLILAVAVILFFLIGADNIWDSTLGKAAAITLISLWIASMVWQTVEAIVYFVKNR